MKNHILPLLTLAALAAAPSAHATLIISEGFNYTLASTNPDADASSGQGDGLPATNVGGSPSGTGTGLRNTWGATTTVVTGLTYSNSGGTLSTSGGAGLQTTTGFGGGQPFVYRFMATDPHLSQRIGGSNSAAFGVDGTSLYISLLGQTSSATADSFRLAIKDGANTNFYLANTATDWRFNGATGGGSGTASLSLNTPTLFIIKIDFAAGSTDTLSLWVNPTLGQPLGVANTVQTGQNYQGFNSLQTNSTVANAMTWDEFRMGTALADVMPTAIPEPSTYAVIAGMSILGLAVSRRRRQV